MTSKKEHAVALAEQGFRIFPLAPNGKTPALDSNWRVIASSDPTRVAEMWTCPVTDAEHDFNIGIALTSDVLVFDEDTANGKQGAKSRALLEAIYEELPVTRTHISASGGVHRLFKTDTPVGNSASKVGQHIDIKSEGGFIVAPGSTIDGNEYTVSIDAPITLAPEFLITMAGKPRERVMADTATPLVDLDGPDAVSRATEYLTTKAPDSGTFSVAAKVKDFGVSQEKCLDLMLEHWRDARSLDKDDSHIEFRVQNAYRYGQNAPGISAAEAEFDAVEIDTKPAPKKKGLYFIPWNEAHPDLNQPFLIDDVMDLGAMVVTYGDSNAGKTYVVLDQDFHIAAGLDWNGHKVKQGLVVYVAAEGGKGFQKRIEAFRRHYKADDLPFALIPCPIDLQSEQADTNKLIKVIREAEAHFGQKCVKVDIDTLARAMGGGDENLTADMSKLVKHCDIIREATGATVNLIHHTGKDKAKGARGSSALRAATDTEIEIEPGIFTVQKQRDMEKIGRSEFSLKAVEVGHRADGKPVTACVVEWVQVSEFETRVTPAAAEMLALFDQLLEARYDELLETEDGADINKLNISVAWDAWRLLGLSHFKGQGGKQVSPAYLYKLRRELVTSGLVAENKQKQWLKGNSNLSN